MQDISITFKNQPALHIKLKDIDLAKRYKSFVQDNYSQTFPTFRDSARYNESYLNTLAIQAKEKLGWEWASNIYDIETTTRLHKDVESLIGSGFQNVPAELDELINELHACLHAVEQKRSTGALRDSTMTVEWLVDDCMPMPDDFAFDLYPKFGDIRLQNPYVGHPPSMIYNQQDYTNVMQTCKFHDVVKPGIVFCLRDPLGVNTTPTSVPQKYYDFWNTKCAEFVALHGMDKIIRYTGYPVIGSVTNLDDLRQVIVSPILELERIDFN